MKKTKTGLVLHKEVVRKLTSDSLRSVHGGRAAQSDVGCEPPNTEPPTNETDTRTDLTHN